MSTIAVQVSGYYRDATTTVRAAVKQTVQGRPYLEINRRQMRAAADRCCYAGTDSAVPSQVDGYGEWQSYDDGSMVAYAVGV